MAVALSQLTDWSTGSVRLARFRALSSLGVIRAKESFSWLMPPVMRRSIAPTTSSSESRDVNILGQEDAASLSDTTFSMNQALNKALEAFWSDASSVCLLLALAEKTCETVASSVS